MAVTDRQITGFLEALAAWLVTSVDGGGLLDRVNIDAINFYVGFLPETKGRIASVMNVGSAAPRDWGILERFSIQIITRGVGAMDVAETMERAELIHDAFLDPTARTPVRGIDLGTNWLMKSADPIRPQSIGLDGSGRVTVSSNISIIAGLKPAE